MQSYWYTGGPELLARGERGQRQMNATSELTSGLGQFAKRYYDYAKEGKDLRLQQDVDQYAQAKAGARQAQQEAASPASMDTTTDPMGSEAPDVVAKPTVDVNDDTGSFTSSAQDVGQKALGGFTSVARRLLAPWGMMDDPERDALRRSHMFAGVDYERRKGRDKLIQSMLPVVDNPGELAGQAGYPELSGARRRPTPSHETMADLAVRASKGDVVARQALDILQQNAVAQRQAGRATPGERIPKLSEGFEEDPGWQDYTLPDGTTVQGPEPGKDPLGMFPSQALTRWKAQHPDWETKYPDGVPPVTPGTVHGKKRRPLSGGGGGGFPAPKPSPGGWGGGAPIPPPEGAPAGVEGTIPGYHLEPDSSPQGYHLVPDVPDVPGEAVAPMDVTAPTSTTAMTRPPTTSTTQPNRAVLPRVPAIHSGDGHEYGPGGLRFTQ